MPSSTHGDRPAPRPGRKRADDGRAARAPVGARVGKEVTVALEAQAERRRNGRAPHDRHVVQRVVEVERETGHQQGTADFNPVDRRVQMRWRERSIDHRLRQRRAVQLDHSHVDLAPRVHALPPERLAVFYSGIEKSLESARLSGSI